MMEIQIMAALWRHLNKLLHDRLHIVPGQPGYCLRNRYVERRRASELERKPVGKGTNLRIAMSVVDRKKTLLSRQGRYGTQNDAGVRYFRFRP